MKICYIVNHKVLGEMSPEEIIKFFKTMIAHAIVLEMKQNNTLVFTYCSIPGLRVENCIYCAN